MLKRIELKNFEIHKDLKIDLNSGLVALVGSSNVGKSAICNAISFVMFNNLIGDSFINKDADTCSVKLILDDDTEIERIKGKGVNAYVIRYPDGEIKRFDAIGREVPEEVRRILQPRILEIDGERISLNIYNQFDPHFFLSLTAPQRGRFLAKIGFLWFIDLIERFMKKDYENEKRKLAEFEEKVKAAEECGRALSSLVQKKEIASQLEINLEHLKKEYERYRIVIEKTLALRLRVMKRDSISLFLNEILKKGRLEEILKEIEEIELIVQKIERLNFLTESIRVIEKDLKRLETEYNKHHREFEKKLSDLGICPLCGQPTKKGAKP